MDNHKVYCVCRTITYTKVGDSLMCAKNKVFLWLNIFTVQNYWLAITVQSNVILM